MYSGCLDLGLGLGDDPSGLRGLPFGHPLGLGGGGGSSICFLGRPLALLTGCSSAFKSPLECSPSLDILCIYYINMLFLKMDG